MAQRDRPHIYLRERAAGEHYTSPGLGRGPKRPPGPHDPDAHAERLRRQYAQAQRSQPATSPVAGAVAGFTIELSSLPGFVHNLDRGFFGLASTGKTPELKVVRTETSSAGDVQVAVVFVPNGAAGTFLSALDNYEGERTPNDNRKQADLVERIASIRRATIRALWTDDPTLFPDDRIDVWWEVWLRRRDGHELDRLASYLQTVDTPMASRSLRLDDRLVVLVRATTAQLAGAVDVLDDLVELRKPAEHLGFLTDLAPADQADWVDDLADRLNPAAADAPHVCLLDTGVERIHPLLEGSLDPGDCHTVEPTWGTEDRDGHGTEMAGIALYGDLAPAVVASGTHELWHRLESVKAFKDANATRPDAYGAVTSEAVSRPEITAPDRRRVFSMTFSAAPTSTLPGEPTSWSATLDALAAGRGVMTDIRGVTYLDDTSDRAARLIVVSTGSTIPDSGSTDHLDWADSSPVEDPAQAWNVLTVGAFTDLHDLTGDTSFADWTATALPGDLSPFSSTGLTFATTWPHKPDVVAEGGNTATSPSGDDIDTPASLQLLTTGRPSRGRLLWTTHGTSPATAAVAGIAAGIWAVQPDLWPETVRALVVHSATWTQRMSDAFAPAKTQQHKVSLLRRYGWGVPSLPRALQSATDALTLVAEDTIRPFDGNGATDELRLHTLPWPSQALRDLDESEVNLRVTLSYFVDPNPSRRGWNKRFAYQSHGLRFAVKRDTDTLEIFQKRINKAAREDGDKTTAPTEKGWLLGADARTNGSLHADIWTGTARQLAERDTIAVYPVGGWWKDQPKRDRSTAGVRYALIVSIETEPNAADIWTPVAAQVGIPIIT